MSKLGVQCVVWLLFVQPGIERRAEFVVVSDVSYSWASRFQLVFFVWTQGVAAWEQSPPSRDLLRTR